MWLKSVPSRYRRADLPSVRIVLLKYAELLVLSIAALHYKRNHSSKGSHPEVLDMSRGRTFCGGGWGCES